KTTSPRMVDRIGGPEGTFVCTIPENRAPYSKYERSIPYHIPEDDITRSPSYHIYRIKGRIEGACIGESAPLFWDKRGIKCGGAEQIKFPKTIESMDLKNVEEIER
ncbi:MAG: hypothetical protein IJR47_03445, partial [Clostridia bacterium]|nr:hypothetical protein [Clostridia bacterium]